MQVMLMDEAGKTPLRYIKGLKVAAMAGTLVSPLHTLRDTSGTQGAFFVFSDISVRMEGSFRLRFELYEMEGTEAGTKKRGKKSTACESFEQPAVKRTKRSDSNIQHSFEAGTTVFTRIGTSVSRSPPVTLQARDILSTGGAPNPGLLIFNHDPFAVYRSENESMPASSQGQCYQPQNVFELDDGYYHKQLSNPHSSPTYGTKTYSHSLDLSDMAAVALLDSLSGGNGHCFGATAKHVSPPTVSDVDLSRLLAPANNASLQQQQPSQSPFTSLATPTGFNMGAPYSNYRVTSTRSTEYPGNQLATSVSACNTQSSFMNAAARFCPPFRSSVGNNCSNDLLIPLLSQRLYNSQVRTVSSSSSNGGGSESCLGLDLTFPQPTGRQEEAWNGAFT
ncbi:hypothetical protein GGI21_001400 [Coemansia aciculifera]|uniref:Uncharacterized protein n=1 Tax=Coemansia aciculifera TaxID=417176 RepID=A0ACC1M835_9FUNG|nr:hypothetical protein IWW38_001455 [Coemansia aciculifera]KAJ2909914.1 hypothetical protein GGI21_001400 [Coemansia aciculifera]